MQILYFKPELLIFILLFLFALNGEGFSPSPVKSKTNKLRLHYRKATNPSDDADNSSGANSSVGIKKRISSFWNSLTGRAEAQPSSGNRFELRLVNPSAINKRHITTRLMRYLPDLRFETATEIVSVAIGDGKSLIRVFNSRSEADDVANMLRIADPPILTELYDNKKQEVL